jgi:glutathione peroxidase
MGMARTAYDFSFDTLAGEPYPLAALRGRPLLVVNTASQCGFTPQYTGLEALWRARQAQGLVVIGVPCDDFGHQEPGDAAEIGAFCEKNFGVSFPIMAKVHVRGEERHPFFGWLAEAGGVLSRPRWNFYKYLIGADGHLANWFASLTKPESAKLQRAVDRVTRA